LGSPLVASSDDLWAEIMAGWWVDMKELMMALMKAKMKKGDSTESW